MPITWMRSADLSPDGGFPNTDFVAFDGEEIIGRLGVFTYVKAGRRSLW
jgi:hypothetical protein